MNRWWWWRTSTLLSGMLRTSGDASLRSLRWSMPWMGNIFRLLLATIPWEVRRSCPQERTSMHSIQTLFQQKNHGMSVRNWLMHSWTNGTKPTATIPERLVLCCGLANLSGTKVSWNRRYSTWWEWNLHGIRWERLLVWSWSRKMNLKDPGSMLWSPWPEYTVTTGSGRSSWWTGVHGWQPRQTIPHTTIMSKRILM